MAKTRTTLTLLVALLLAGCRQGVPTHEGATFGVSPDGKRLAWTTGAGGNNELWLRDESGERRVLAGRFFEGPSFTPDGRLVVGVGDSIRHRMELQWVDPKDGSLKPFLAMPEHSQYSPSFAPDGRVAFLAAAKPRSRAQGGLQWSAFDLYVMGPDDEVAKRLTEGNYIRMSSPAWSPDLKEIAFSFLDDSGVSWLRIVDPESGKTITETKLKNNESMPTYVGDRMVIVSDREHMGRYRLVYVIPETAEIEPITKSESYFLEPVSVGGAIYALEDITHKMRFRVSKIEPATGQSSEVLAEKRFDVAEGKSK